MIWKRIFYCFILITITTTEELIAQNEHDSSKMELIKSVQEWFLQQQDTNYISNYNHEISLRILGVSKYNYIKIVDRNTGSNILYYPDSKVSLGAGITYRWFSLDLTFKSDLAQRKAQSSTAFDFQAKIFSPKQYIGLTYKYYYGYIIGDYNNLSVEIPDSIQIRDDIRTSLFGLEYMYAFNYGRFSFKAPFLYNEIQKKSAGSFVVGVSFTSYILDGDSDILPELAKPDFNPKLYFSSLNTINLSFDGGYMYTLVFLRKFYLTLSAIPGIVLVAGDYRIDEREFLDLRASLKFSSMNSIGYNSRRFYAGLQFTNSFYLTKVGEKSGTQDGYMKLKLFAGFRLRKKV